MKKELLLLLFILTLNIIHCQNKNLLGKNYYLISNIEVKTSSNIGRQNDQLLNIKRGTNIVIDAYNDSNYVCRVLPFIDSIDNVNIVYKYSKNGSTEDIYFTLSFKDFEKYCTESIKTHSFSLGIPTIPIKLRFGNGGSEENPRYFNFEGNINLGLSLGYKYSFGLEKQQSISIVSGFTLSFIPLDSLSTKGKIITKTSASSFSPHFGLIFSDNNFQFGVFTGIDFLYGETNKYWIYKNQPWLGIGFGYSLFNSNNVTKN